jgi:acetyl esterase/lipase
MRMLTFVITVGLACAIFVDALPATEINDVWPKLAPGETTRNRGETLPFRENEKPRVTRVVKISRPTFTVHLAEKPTGAAAVILPGGGFGKVVPDKEGTEVAQWLNQQGIAAFVLSYRTTEDSSVSGWVKPLQDAQRMMALVRSQAKLYGLKTDQIGLAGFSAGGQVAAKLLCDQGKLSYQRIDEVDDVSHRPDFAMLIYPWRVYDTTTGSLIAGVNVTQDVPPTFIVHTDDDASSSLGAVLFYAELKKLKISSELHVYGDGGHGYGLRKVFGSQISTWTDHAADWLAKNTTK